jgi:hypothetical protein
MAQSAIRAVPAMLMRMMSGFLEIDAARGKSLGIVDEP